MTEREKLVQLIVEKQDCGLTHNSKGQDFVTYNAELADHLIANGVTVQQWISVVDEKPNGWFMVDPDTYYREPETYIVFVKGAMRPTTAYYLDGKFVPPCDGFLSRENCDRLGFTDDITHWMPLPEPPKEREVNE